MCFSLSRHRRPTECIMGITFSSRLGVNVDVDVNGAASSLRMIRSGYGFAMFKASDVEKSIKILKKADRSTNLLAHLSYSDKFSCENRDKSLDAAFALLYDFVDAFVISGYGFLPDRVDSLLNIRLYNDEYRPILLKVGDDLLDSELDNLISYALLSDLDGLVISNPRLLEKAKGRANGVLTLIYDGVSDSKNLSEVLQSTPLAMVRAGKTHIKAFNALPAMRKLANI